MQDYTKPSMTVIGSLHELTLGDLNKVGHNPDVYSSIVPIVGSIVSAP